MIWRHDILNTNRHCSKLVELLLFLSMIPVSVCYSWFEQRKIAFIIPIEVRQYLPFNFPLKQCIAKPGDIANRKFHHQRQAQSAEKIEQYRIATDSIAKERKKRTRRLIQLPFERFMVLLQILNALFFSWWWRKRVLASAHTRIRCVFACFKPIDLYSSPLPLCCELDVVFYCCGFKSTTASARILFKVLAK